MESRRVVFTSGRGYLLKRELGRGACGITVLLHDEAIDEHFVCKKYAPQQDTLREQLFASFLREIKLMHAVHHINVVRVFNYIVYPERFSGYIFMEYVDGLAIDEYVASHPEDINRLFLQVVEGFAHLEIKRVLHRDIRASNVLVAEGGVVKIIDFGFGKQAANSADFDKSISLNWWCALPPEFAERIYDFATEVYFVGKLFELLIERHELSHFQHGPLLRRMVEPTRQKRLESFSRVRQELHGQPIRSIEFSQDHTETYRWFAQTLAGAVSKLEMGATFYEIADIHLRLDDAYKKMMLEEFVADSTIVTRCVVIGGYYYPKNYEFPVECVKAFLDLLNACGKEQRNIIEANLHARLDALPKYEKKSGFDDMDDDIPF